MQAAIDECCGTGDPTTTVRRAVYGLDLPSGAIGLGSPVRVRSVLDFDMRGQGAHTRLHSAPGSTPSGGGILYVESGALKYKGTSGTITTLAAA